MSEPKCKVCNDTGSLGQGGGLEGAYSFRMVPCLCQSPLAAKFVSKSIWAEGVVEVPRSEWNELRAALTAALARAEKAEAEAADAHAAARKNLAPRDAAEERAFDADAAARRRAREHMTAAHAQRDAAVQRAEAAERERDEARELVSRMEHRALYAEAKRDALAGKFAEVSDALSAALSRQRRVAGDVEQLATDVALAVVLMAADATRKTGVAELHRVVEAARALAAELEGTP